MLRNEAIARKEISEYIRYYNTRRLHSSVPTPEEFEDIKHSPGDAQGGPRRPKNIKSREESKAGANSGWRDAFSLAATPPPF